MNKLVMMISAIGSLHWWLLVSPLYGEPTIGKPIVGELTISKLTVGELTFGELTVEEPAANEPDLIQCTKSTTGFLSDNGQDFLGDDYAEDAFPKVLPAPLSCIPLVPSDSPNKTRMAVVRDKTHILGSKTLSQVLWIDFVKIDS